MRFLFFCLAVLLVSQLNADALKIAVGAGYWEKSGECG